VWVLDSQGVLALPRERAGTADGARMVIGLRAQDPAVARPLWRQFAPTVLRILRRTLGPRVVVDDALREVFVTIFRGGRRLRPNSDLRRVVLKATARVAQARLRKLGASWPCTSPWPRGLYEPGARTAGSQEPEPLRQFHRILDRLTARDRVAFELHYIEGIELREVADALGAHRVGRLAIEALRRSPRPLRDDRTEVMISDALGTRALRRRRKNS
jgi:RNA polymerase sigma factor (sigma-70 family)